MGSGTNEMRNGWTVGVKMRIMKKKTEGNVASSETITGRFDVDESTYRMYPRKRNSGRVGLPSKENGNRNANEEKKVPQLRKNVCCMIRPTIGY